MDTANMTQDLVQGLSATNLLQLGLIALIGVVSAAFLLRASSRVTRFEDEVYQLRRELRDLREHIDHTNRVFEQITDDHKDHLVTVADYLDGGPSLDSAQLQQMRAADARLSSTASQVCVELHDGEGDLIDPLLPSDPSIMVSELHDPDVLGHIVSVSDPVRRVAQVEDVLRDEDFKDRAVGSPDAMRRALKISRAQG